MEDACAPHCPVSIREMTQELRNIGLQGLACLLVTSLCLAAYANWRFALQWGGVALTLWAYVWQQSWTRRAMNRADRSGPLYATLGKANRLTILRGLLIAMTGGFILQEDLDPLLISLAALFYSVAAILDRVDGFIARRQQQTSLMGNALDNVFDAMGLLVAPLLAVDLGKVHWSYLLVSVAYYAFHLGLAWRARRQLITYELAPNKLRRTLAGFQMGYVAVVLWPPFAAPVTSAAGFAFMLPILLGFVIDWGVVSGRIQAHKHTRGKAFATLERYSHRYFQPALRCVFLLALIVLLASATLRSWELAIMTLSGLLIIIGCGVRIVALALLIALSTLSIAETDSLAFLTLSTSAIWIALLGGGAYSVWQGDDVWVERHDGAP